MNICLTYYENRWCLHWIVQEETLNPSILQQKVKDFFHIQIAERTCTRWLRRNNFSRKKVSRKSGGYVYIAEEGLQIGMLFFRHFWKEWLAGIARDKLFCLDFTYSTLKYGKEVSWTPVGRFFFLFFFSPFFFVSSMILF